VYGIPGAGVPSYLGDLPGRGTRHAVDAGGALVLHARGGGSAYLELHATTNGSPVGSLDVIPLADAFDVVYDDPAVFVAAGTNGIAVFSVTTNAGVMLAAATNYPGFGAYAVAGDGIRFVVSSAGALRFYTIMTNPGLKLEGFIE
jgi:hypothetical protein